MSLVEPVPLQDRAVPIERATEDFPAPIDKLLIELVLCAEGPMDPDRVKLRPQKATDFRLSRLLDPLKERLALALHAADVTLSAKRRSRGLYGKRKDLVVVPTLQSV